MHGFGISKEQQMIQELSFVLNKRKYTHEVVDTKIMITYNGEPIEVTAVDEAYMIKYGRDSGIIHRKTTKRKTLQGAVNLITVMFGESKKNTGLLVTGGY
ncbi:hypothetical protein Q0N71_06105 [Bacillus thuringiensis]|uniref:hypothetical protein n=1 Tax=Bacillus thuringiensis TaxID=1428 RepID=UPI00345918FA